MTDRTWLPPQTPRVETGVTQFGEDWPGVFLRGDNAMAFGMTLRMVLENGQLLNTVITRNVVKGLADLLLSCDVRELEGWPHD